MPDHSDAARLGDGYAAFSKEDFVALNDFFAEDILWHVGGGGQLPRDYQHLDAVTDFF